MREHRAVQGRLRAPHRARAFSRAIGVAPWLALLLFAVSSRAQQPLPDEIQRQREDMERRKIEYKEEKALVDDLNARVERYKQLRESIPFTGIPGTSNLLQVHVNRHDVREVAHELYFLTTDATPEGFEREYWRTFLVLNQADQYPGGVPQYGTFDASHPEENVAVFPNIRKRDMSAVVAELAIPDTAFAMQYTSPVVAAYERRLRERVLKESMEAGEPPLPTGPSSMPGTNASPLLTAGPKEPSDTYPPRRITDETSLAAAGRVERQPVPVAREIALDPAPPAWALGQEVTMLGAGYQGYETEYQPGNFELLPEGGAMAFFGGRDSQGNAKTQPGLYFSFNQKLWHLLVLNEMAFAAFGSGDAPPVNGGSLGAGIDFESGPVGVTGLVGLTAFNTIGETDSGVSFTGKLRYAIAPRVSIGGIYMISDVEIFQVDTNGQQLTGITQPSFIGLNLTVR